jgi:tetratricopeptide (TPR) repeat protein
MDLAPNSAQVIMVAGLAFLTLGDYGATVDAQRRAIALDPDLFLPYLLRGIAEVARGNNTIAIELFRQAEKLVQNIPSPDMIGMIAYGYGRAGSAEDAQRMFSRIQAMSTEFHVGSASWTLAHLGIKDLDSARASLRLAGDDWAVDEGFMSLCTLAFNTSSDPILERADIEEARTRLGFR